MSDTATAQQGTSAASRRWFQKDGGSPLDRMPALAEAMAAVARSWTDTFGKLAAVPGEITVRGMHICKLDDVVGQHGLNSLVAVLYARGWNTAVGVNFDRRFVAIMTDALFGGEGEEFDPDEASLLSPVDTRIAELVGKQVADALAVGFAGCLPSPFIFDRLQPKFDVGFLGKPTAVTMVTTLALTTIGAPVEIDILIPFAVLTAFAEELSEVQDDTQAVGDPRWTQRLETEIGRADMRLQAAMDLDPITLGAITRLQIGQVLTLPRGAGRRVRLLCGGDDLFLCDLGQSDGFYTLKIEEVVGMVEETATTERATVEPAVTGTAITEYAVAPWQMDEGELE